MMDLSGTDIQKIKNALEKISNAESQAIVDLYRSIWKMTYANAKGYENMELAKQIALMNEQEGLVPDPPVPVDQVIHLDLGGFPEAVFFPELLRYTNIQRLDFWENNLEKIPVELLQLPSLVELYVGDGVEELPDFLLEMPSLKEINMVFKEGVEIPEEQLEKFAAQGIRVVC